MNVPVGMGHLAAEMWAPYPHPAASYLPIQHPMFPFAHRPGTQVLLFQLIDKVTSSVMFYSGGFPHEALQQLAWQSQFVPATTFQPSFPMTTAIEPQTTQMISMSCDPIRSTSAPMSIQPTSENTTSSSSTRPPLYVRRYLRAQAAQATCQLAVHNKQPTMSIQISGTSAANTPRPTGPQSMQATCSTGHITEPATNTQSRDHMSHLQVALTAPPANRTCTLSTHPHSEWAAYGYHHCKCEASQMAPIYFYSRPLAASAIIPRVPLTPVSDNHEGATVKPPSPENEHEEGL